MIILGTVANLCVILLVVSGAFALGRRIGRREGFRNCSGAR